MQLKLIVLFETNHLTFDQDTGQLSFCTQVLSMLQQVSKLSDCLARPVRPIH